MRGGKCILIWSSYGDRQAEGLCRSEVAYETIGMGNDVVKRISGITFLVGMYVGGVVMAGSLQDIDVMICQPDGVWSDNNETYGTPRDCRKDSSYGRSDLGGEGSVWLNGCEPIVIPYARLVNAGASYTVSYRSTASRSDELATVNIDRLNSTFVVQITTTWLGDLAGDKPSHQRASGMCKRGKRKPQL
jgi:hypothetical protein